MLGQILQHGRAGIGCVAAEIVLRSRGRGSSRMSSASRGSRPARSGTALSRLLLGFFHACLSAAPIVRGGALRTAKEPWLHAVNMLARNAAKRHGSPMSQSPHPPKQPRRAAVGPDFRHVRDWIFDLDNTLYRADNGIFAQIDARMTDFVARASGTGARRGARACRSSFIATMAPP